MLGHPISGCFPNKYFTKILCRVYNKPRLDKVYLHRILQSLVGLTNMEYNLLTKCFVHVQGWLWDCATLTTPLEFCKKSSCVTIFTFVRPAAISINYLQTFPCNFLKKSFVLRIKGVTTIFSNIWWTSNFVSKGFWHCLLRLDLN